VKIKQHYRRGTIVKTLHPTLQIITAMLRALYAAMVDVYTLQSALLVASYNSSRPYTVF